MTPRPAPLADRIHSGPPLPDKLQRPRHGPDGRIQSIESYEGVAARQLMAWEKYIADAVAAGIAGERKAARARQEAVLSALETLGAEIGKDVAGLTRQLEAQAAQIALLEARLAAVEPKPKPKLVEDSDAAA